MRTTFAVLSFIEIDFSKKTNLKWLKLEMQFETNYFTFKKGDIFHAATHTVAAVIKTVPWTG